MAISACTCSRNGSPPLARRGQVAAGGLPGGARFTSARPERTRPSSPWLVLTPVHLRSRGEDGSFRTAPESRPGSPPLARRGLIGPAHRGGDDRFTSARAERTAAPPAWALWTAVHLRSRGEDLSPVIGWIVAGGSPPLARRGLHYALVGVASARFTSARAERTEGPPPCPWGGPVHLRSRGEDPSRPAVLGALCRFVIQGTPVMYTSESSGHTASRRR